MNATEVDGYVASIVRASLLPMLRGWASPVHIGLMAVFCVACWASWKGISRIPEHYKAIGRLECQQATSSQTAKSIAHQATEVVSQAASDVSRAQAAGAQTERTRNRINAHFTRLAEEARHDPIDPVDSCVLPAVRLRRWESANAGDSGSTASVEGAPASQPDSATAASASTGLRSDLGPGSESQGSRPGLSPAGQPALQPAQVHGDSAR